MEPYRLVWTVPPDCPGQRTHWERRAADRPDRQWCAELCDGFEAAYPPVAFCESDAGVLFISAYDPYIERACARQGQPRGRLYVRGTEVNLTRARALHMHARKAQALKVYPTASERSTEKINGTAE